MIKRGNKIASLIAAGIIIAPTIIATPVFAKENNNSANKTEAKLMEIVDQKLNVDTILKDMNNLVVGDNARVSGLGGEKAAAKYLAKEFNKLGLDTEIEDFDIKKPVSVGNGYLNIDGETLFIKSLNGGEPIKSNFNAEAIYVGLGTPEDIAKVGSLEGKIAIVERGDNTFAQKAENTYKAGAEAVIIVNNNEGAATGSLGNNPAKMPVLGTSQADGQKIISKLKNNETVTLTKENFDINIDYKEEGKSYNVIGKLKAGKNHKKAKTIVLGAHFDSVSSPGASDNATGTAVIVEVARILSSKDVRKNLNYNIEFVAFGAEELGLLGSRDYVEELKDDKKVDKIEAMINLDMVGVGDYINVFNLDNNISSKFSELASKHIKAGEGVYGGNYTNMSSSDHAPFEEVGIKASLVQTGPDPRFHTEKDTMEHIDSKNLKDVARVVARMIVDMQDNQY